MILYFSGTGNSRSIAKLLASELGESADFILKDSPAEIKFSGKYLGFVFPVYSWGVPPLVLDYVRNLNPQFINDADEVPVFIICVCGDEVALAPEMIKKGLSEKGLTLAGGWSVQMPNNYVILPGFDVDSEEVELQKLKEAPGAVKTIAGNISENRWEENYVRGGSAWLKSRLIYPLFKRWGIFPERWQVSQACVGCGKCEEACPMKNLKLKEGTPTWGTNCVSCLACYHICPRHAVNYGRATLRKGQYFHPHHDV